MKIFIERKISLVCRMFFAFLMVFIMGISVQKLEAREITGRGLDFQMSSNWYKNGNHDRVDFSTGSHLTNSNKCVEYYFESSTVYRTDWNCGKNMVTPLWAFYNMSIASAVNGRFHSGSSDHWHQGWHHERSNIKAAF